MAGVNGEVDCRGEEAPETTASTRTAVSTSEEVEGVVREECEDGPGAVVSSENAPSPRSPHSGAMDGLDHSVSHSPLAASCSGVANSSITPQTRKGCTMSSGKIRRQRGTEEAMFTKTDKGVQGM